ncbi:MAG: hypothetical protein JO033_26230 [Acidobacteriaceae bacterium]|nr:hypothetical protein [Acidobacteriaceae bacterium]MBV9499531.1 hypothetical protein [Acidobacteriaceae bacterium]
MGLEALVHIRKAIGTLNPQQVRDLSERQLRIALHARSQEGYQRMEQFFLQDLSPARRSQSATQLVRAPIPPGAPVDLDVYDYDVVAPPNGLILSVAHGHEFVRHALARQSELGVAMARSFVPFRRPFIDRVVARVARENTLFSVTTALPDVIPSVIELPWAVAEFASDTAFLTMNQVRMAFLIAAGSDREVGYRHQKSEIATVIGSAFGWRALARQLVGKIPLGGGLIAKAAVSYAGTKVLGLSLERYYRIGFTFTRHERDHMYWDAFRQGKRVALKFLSSVRPELAKRFEKELQEHDRTITAVSTHVS